MNLQKIIELAQKSAAHVKQWDEQCFDLTNGETEKAYIFRSSDRTGIREEEFIAASILRVFEILGFSQEEKKSNLQYVKIDWLQSDAQIGHGKRYIDPRESLHILGRYNVTFPGAERIEALCEIDLSTGLCDSFCVGRTDREYLSLYWYTTG